METPPFERETTGFWLDVPKLLLDLMYSKNINAAEAIHSASHAILNRFPMGKDLKTECKVRVREEAVDIRAHPRTRSRIRSTRLQSQIASDLLGTIPLISHTNLRPLTYVLVSSFTTQLALVVALPQQRLSTVNLYFSVYSSAIH